MKRKMYTKTNDERLLKEIDNNGGQFTAEEHAYVNKKALSKHFESKNSLLRYYLSQNYFKLDMLSFLIKHTYDNNAHNLLSLGAGTCVFEYLLKSAMPVQSKLVATDFDRFLIEKAKFFFPEIITKQFDFFKEDILTFKQFFNFNFDMAFFLGSAYVMDDNEFVKLFSGLKKIGVKQIIDAHGGYMDLKSLVSNIMHDVFVASKTLVVKKLFGKLTYEKQWLGKFHGYSRSQGELRRLYKNSRLKINKEFSLNSFKYIAVLS